jgi:hypothetical protein
MQLEARLHIKLLLYKEGDHFEVGRDIEKEKGMFAILVLRLLTKTGFKGVMLMVKHKNWMRTFGLSKVRSTGFSYIVFYDDCQHKLQSQLRLSPETQNVVSKMSEYGHIHLGI